MRLHPDLQDLVDRGFGVSTKGRPSMRTTGNVDLSPAGVLYCDRLERRKHFDTGLFHEPAWDILLYMLEASAHGQDTVSIHVIAELPSSISEPSTERWLGTLISRGYITYDAAFGHLRLTSKAKEAFASYVAAIGRERQS